jgi:hypothetical protein
MSIPERMEKRHQWYQKTSRNWCLTYYSCVVTSIVTPAVASVLAFWKDSYPWVVALLAAVGAISSGVLAQLKPKTEWDNFRNAHVYFLPYITRYEDGLIGPEELNQAFAEAERFVGPVPVPPSGQPPPHPPPPSGQPPTPTV